MIIKEKKGLNNGINYGEKCTGGEKSKSKKYFYSKIKIRNVT